MPQGRQPVHVFKVELNHQDYERLVKAAVDEWRPLRMQAEVMLRRALRAESHEQLEEERYVCTAQQR